MSTGPTRGATEEPSETTWKAAPGLAFAIRAVAFLAPLLAAFVVVRLLAGVLFRPDGWAGFLVWVAQATAIGSVISIVVDRGTRRLLPLATLFGMSLVFPDQAPPRFGIALRSGTVRQLQNRLDDVRNHGLGSSEGEAAQRAVELVAALGHHDRLTRGHTERVRAYADLIGEELGLPAADRARLSWSVLLHDVGKLTVPPEILNKAGRPTADEWQHLRNHPAASAELLEPLADWLGDWIGAASEHHERWDGDGYPRGLAGTDISLAGRIAAVADAYDVITSKRSYKEPMSASAARRELVDNAGSQFDPAVVRAFLNVSLGRRWMVGPFAWLADLPIGQIVTTVTTTPVVASVGAVMAVTSVAAVAIAETEPEQLAYVATDADEEPPMSSLPPSSDIPTSATGGANEPGTTASEPSTATSATTVAAGPAGSTSSGPPATGPTATVQAATTTTPGPDQTTTTTTAPPTTTTTAPTTTTTTAPTTTTTTAPTTTTTSPPVGSLYHLKNPGTGDSTAQLFKTLGTGVDDSTQPNFDTERDSVPGLRLEPTSSGWNESDLVRIQRYGRSPGTDDLDGPAKITLYAAADSDVGGSPVTLRVSLNDCNVIYQGCTIIAESSVLVSNSIGEDGFAQFVVDFGSVTHNFSGNRRIVVRLIAEGSETLHTAFDSDPYPAVLDVTWS